MTYLVTAVAAVVLSMALAPRLGGIAMTVAAAVPAAAALGLADRRVTAILLAAAAVAVLGLIEDTASLPVITRLTVESVAAGGVVLSGVQVTLTGDWLDGPVTVMWVVLVTNAFSLLDSIGGALGAVTTVTAAFLAGTALVLSEPAVAVLLTALGCASLGFLRHNWPPARILMGSSGSLFAGFVLTCAAIVLTAGRSTGTIAAGLLLPAFVAIIGAGGHVAHRLGRVGLGPRMVAVTLAGVSAVTGAVCLAVAMGRVPPAATATVTAVTAVTLIGLLRGHAGAAGAAGAAGSSPRVSARP